MTCVRTWTKSLLLALLVTGSHAVPTGKPTTLTVLSPNTDCTTELNGGIRQCCLDSGSCQDSSCTIFGFPNSAKANCQIGPHTNCPDSYCNWTVPECIENAENHCFGYVACNPGYDECSSKGELCLQDGNSDNFKICADLDTSATSTTLGTTTLGTIAVETTTDNGNSLNGKSYNDKKLRTGWPQDGCDEPTDDTYPEFEEGDGVACSFQDVLDLLKDYDCKIPKSACNECFCDTPLPPDVVAQLKACAVLNDFNSNVERIIDSL